MKTWIKSVCYNILGTKISHSMSWLYHEMRGVHVPENEQMYMAAVGEHIVPGTTAVDIGANVGSWTGYLSRRVGAKGRVIALEPVPESFRYLKRRCRRLENVQAFNVGLSDAAGTKEMILDPSSYSPTDASITETADHIKNADSRQPIEITVETLDTVLEEAHAKEVSFIKCDVEGHEEKVILGSLRTIVRNNPTIFLEILREKWRENNPAHSPCASMLLDMGYKMWQITDQGVLVELDSFTKSSENFLFVSPRR